ncbi:hypothetical protein P3S13_09775, partial [Limosilactobacillus fermentum]|nr:hypothetical protein [Limosilactobacillus fermentum]
MRAKFPFLHNILDTLNIELSQALVWLLNSLKTIINHEVYARIAQIIQMMNQFFTFLHIFAETVS